MLQIVARAFVEQGARLREFQGTVRFGVGSNKIGDGDLALIIEQLEAFRKSFENLRFETTEGIIREYLEDFRTEPRPTYETAAACARAIEISLRMV